MHSDFLILLDITTCCFSSFKQVRIKPLVINGYNSFEPISIPFVEIFHGKFVVTKITILFFLLTAHNNNVSKKQVSFISILISLNCWLLEILYFRNDRSFYNFPILFKSCFELPDVSRVSVSSRGFTVLAKTSQKSLETFKNFLNLPRIFHIVRGVMYF